MMYVSGAFECEDIYAFVKEIAMVDLNKIVQVNILKENKVISCLFADGDEQKAVCDEQDKFSLENGIAVCVAKHAMGGSSNYNGAIRQGLRVYKEQEKTKADLEERKRIEENHKRKHQRYLDRKKNRARDARIQEMAEAFKIALKESK